MKSRKHRVVVSAENNAYVAWQVKLFHYSCLTRLQQSPLVVVHETGRGPHPYFSDVVRAGGIVRRAPNYRTTVWGDAYPPRNTAGTLQYAAEACDSQDEFIVLCDPDMIFVREPDFPSALAGDYYSYMDYSQAEVKRAARHLGLKPRRLSGLGDALRCGVPYVIPVAVAGDLARRWLEALDAFPPRRWTDIMHAFGLAAVSMNLQPALTKTVVVNDGRAASLAGDVIHYCYGDEMWDKRHYVREEQARGVWEPPLPARGDAVSSEIFRQIKEAREFYRDSFFPAD